MSGHLGHRAHQTCLVSRVAVALPWGQGMAPCASAAQHGQTRRPGSGGAGHLRLEAPSRLRTAALWAAAQSYGRSSPTAQPWSLSEAPPKTPSALRPCTTQAVELGVPTLTLTLNPNPYKVAVAPFIDEMARKLNYDYTCSAEAGRNAL